LLNKRKGTQIVRMLVQYNEVFCVLILSINATFKPSVEVNIGLSTHLCRSVLNHMVYFDM